jgi:hypothetical protein
VWFESLETVILDTSALSILEDLCDK